MFESEFAARLEWSSFFLWPIYKNSADKPTSYAIRKKAGTEGGKAAQNISTIINCDFVLKTHL